MVVALREPVPRGHPYHIPTIGKHEDIDAANLEDVKDFFKQWYVPNNASLSIAGDFEPAEPRRSSRSTLATSQWATARADSLGRSSRARY